MASKVLLVEDDNNLREIYQARLQAEGYDIVSAKDGEEALVIAKKEQPDLIISDVMMPRVSGFEMLDILRNTEGLKDPKVIMLTALGQSDDQARASQLGADRYLVKSQVTLEDIVKAAQELLSGTPSDPTPAASAATTATSTPETTPAPAPPPAVTSTPTTPVVADTPVATPPADDTTTTPAAADPAPTPAAPPATTPAADPVADPPAPVATPTTPPPPAQTTTNTNDQLMADALKDLTAAADPPADPPTKEPVVEPPEQPAAADPAPTPAAPPATTPEEPTPAPIPSSTSGDSAPVAGKKVIRPLSTPVADPEPNLNELLAKEGITTDPGSGAVVQSGTQDPVMPPPPAGQVAPPHPPGHVISPSPEPQQAAQEVTLPPAPTPPSGGVDPDSIAL